MDDRWQNRIRFSVAHEVGHLILHADLCQAFRPATRDEWIEFVQTVDNDEYFIIEQQAYEFAGRLLVPRDMLLTELKIVKPKVEEAKRKLPNIGESPLREYVAVAVCRRFGVSDQVILRRIEREGLWPIP